MNRTLLLSLLSCLASLFCTAAEPEEVFALYPVVQRDEPGAMSFSYLSAVNLKPVSGFYRREPVLTRAQLLEVESGYPEFNTIPFPALFFRFNSEGDKRLGRFLTANEEGVLVLFVDGHAYATLGPNLISEISMQHHRLKILIPSALEKRDELHRLFQALQTESKKDK